MTLTYIKGEMSMGERTPILAIHGAGGAAVAWTAQRRIVGNDWPFIAVDLPGHGDSPGPACDTIREYLDHVLAFMDELGIDRAIFTGHSMGGAISQLAALENPERVAGLILVATAARLGVAEQIFELLKQDMQQFFMLFERFAFGPGAGDGIINPAREVMEKAGMDTLLKDFTACHQFDERKRASGISVPTLVISAEHDLLTPSQYGQRLAEDIEGARFELLPGVGHMIQAEAYKEVSELMLSFAKGVG